jgi:HEAT repeat protein
MLRELWRTSGNQWPAVALRYTRAGQAELRWAALWSLSRKGGGEVEASLPELLRDPEPQVRLLACEAVRRHRLSGLASSVVALLADSEEGVRVAAMNALAELGEGASQVVTGKALRELDQLIAREDLEHPHLRVAAVRLAGATGCCREALRSLVEEGGWAGGEALLALARQGVREAVEQELASPDPFFRRWAVLALPHHPKNQELVVKALADPEVAVRLATAEVAGKLGAAALSAELTKLLSDPDSAVRLQAAESLFALGRPPDPTILVKLLEQELSGAASETSVDLVRLLGKPQNPRGRFGFGKGPLQPLSGGSPGGLGGAFPPRPGAGLSHRCRRQAPCGLSGDCGFCCQASLLGGGDRTRHLHGSPGHRGSTHHYLQPLPAGGKEVL